MTELMYNDRPEECTCTCNEPMTCRGECGCQYCNESTPMLPDILEINEAMHIDFCLHCKHLICTVECPNYPVQEARRDRVHRLVLAHRLAHQELSTGNTEAEDGEPD